MACILTAASLVNYKIQRKNNNRETTYCIALIQVIHFCGIQQAVYGLVDVEIDTVFVVASLVLIQALMKQL